MKDGNNNVNNAGSKNYNISDEEEDLQRAIAESMKCNPN